MTGVDGATLCGSCGGRLVPRVAWSLLPKGDVTRWLARAIAWQARARHGVTNSLPPLCVCTSDPVADLQVMLTGGERALDEALAAYGEGAS